MKIGELATRAGVSTKTIRYYENIGVIPDAERKPNGYRTYDQTTVERLSFVKDAQAAGLSLNEINLILELRDEGEVTCHHVISMLDSHLHDVDRQLAELTRTRQRLQEMTQRARDLDPSNCTDPNRCQTIQTTNKETS
jgi:DNA-binding transcriptional MerR regulator